MEEVAVDVSKDDSEVGICSSSGNGELAASADTDQNIKPRDMSNNTNATDVDYESHFSLRVPISSVRFRGSMLRVIDTGHDQIILKQQITSNEDDGDNHAAAGNHNKILVKRVAANTYAQRSLRIAYTLITIIFVGFLFVFCCQVFLFIFIALPTNNSDAIWSIPGINIVQALLSIPVLLYGLTSLMTMGCAFVVDAYRGGALFRSTAVEIIYMM